MRTSFVIGKISGIPLKIHLNWIVTAILVTWSLSAGYFPQEMPGWSVQSYWLVGIITSALFFGSVLLHELGHSLVAMRDSVPVNSITLFIFGGVAHIAHEPETPESEFRIVIAGPLTSMLLAGVFLVFSGLTILGEQFTSMSLYLSRINLILAAFNMIPGFPLDGGRVLRSAFWKLSKDFSRSTRWATNAGLGIALLFVVGGIGLMLTGNYIAGVWVAFIGWYLGMAARDGYRQVQEDEAEARAAQTPTTSLRPRPATFSIPTGETRLAGNYAVVRVSEEPPRLAFRPGDGPDQLFSGVASHTDTLRPRPVPPPITGEAAPGLEPAEGMD